LRHHCFCFLWFVLVSLWLLILLPNWDGPARPTNGHGRYLAMWGLFHPVMFIGTLRLNRALQLFSQLHNTILSPCIGVFTAAIPIQTPTTGYEEFFCGFSAIYTVSRRCQ